MGQIKIYPSTQAQVQAVQDTVDEINAKIVTPKYQAKIVDPTTSQQLIQPDAGYEALSSVTVNASSVGRTLETFVMRNNQEDLFDLNLNGNVPNYACYQQNKLKRVSGNVTNIGAYAFYECVSLQEMSSNFITVIDDYGLYHTNIANLYLPVCTIIGNSGIGYIGIHKLDTPSLVSGGQYSLRNNRSIQYWRIGNAQTIPYSWSYGDSKDTFKLVDLTLYDFVPTLEANIFAAQYGCVYLVKDATMKTSFSSATNWSALANNIKTEAEFEQEIGKSYDDYFEEIFEHPRWDFLGENAS